MRFLIGLFFFISVGVSESFCQPWMYELTRKKSTNEITFNDIRQAFNEYWKNKPQEKGKGYKPFRRWEYFIESRVYP